MTGHLLDFRTTQSRGLRFACWVIFHDFVSSADFFEIIIFKIFFQAYYQGKNSMEPDQARRAWSGSKLFAKVISADDTTLASKHFKHEQNAYIYHVCAEN